MYAELQLRNWHRCYLAGGTAGERHTADTLGKRQQLKTGEEETAVLMNETPLPGGTAVRFNALEGRPVSIPDGLRFAAGRWKPILLWSLMAGLVGLLIRKLEEQFGLVGRWVVGLLGLAWSVACVFAIPVLIREPALVNPLDVLKRSASTIRKTWGESLIGWAGLRFGGVLALLASVALLVAGGFVTYLAQSPWPLVLSMFCWLAGLIAFVSRPERTGSIK